MKGANSGNGLDYHGGPQALGADGQPLNLPDSHWATRIAAFVAAAGLVFGASAIAAPAAHATTAEYYLENTSTGTYAHSPSGGSVVPLGNRSGATAFVRINYKDISGTGYYEYSDLNTGNCLHADPNAGHQSVVESLCVAGNYNELFSDPPEPISYEFVYLGFDYPIQSYQSSIHECQGLCSNDQWSLPAYP
jgi:hypothetical protein